MRLRDPGAPPPAVGQGVLGDSAQSGHVGLEMAGPVGVVGSRRTRTGRPPQSPPATAGHGSVLGGRQVGLPRQWVVAGMARTERPTGFPYPIGSQRTIPKHTVVDPTSDHLQFARQPEPTLPQLVGQPASRPFYSGHPIDSSQWREFSSIGRSVIGSGLRAASRVARRLRPRCCPRATGKRPSRAIPGAGPPSAFGGRARAAISN